MRVTIEVDITDEHCAAAKHVGRMAGNMTPQDVANIYLNNAVAACLHRLLSHKKWDDGRFFDQVPEEQGYTSTQVFDAQGKHHDVMLPGDYLRRPFVNTPVEGTQACNPSPTKICWYDDQKDPRWDFCVFCGEPDERK